MIDTTADYMAGYHGGFMLAQMHGLQRLLDFARSTPSMRSAAYKAGVLDAALALVSSDTHNAAYRAQRRSQECDV